MSIAMAERLRKETNPGAYCAEPGCLFRTDDAWCPRHAPVSVAPIMEYGMAAARDSIGRRPPRARLAAKLAVPQPHLGVGYTGPSLLEAPTAVDVVTGQEHVL